MRDFIEFMLITFTITIIMGIMLLVMGMGVDYWNGTSRASLIKKQTGVEYTWREAAQIKHMYDQNNVKIILEDK